MKIHEYQGKEILKRFGVPVPRGIPCFSVDEAVKAAETLDPKASAETLCGVNKSMAKEEIKEKLAVLYRRHNRAASSLDAKMREEAEIMLEAIAAMKEKFLGKK